MLAVISSLLAVGQPSGGTKLPLPVIIPAVVIVVGLTLWSQLSRRRS